jgi:hypothetical protein
MSVHDHDHTSLADAGDAPPGYYEIMETSVRELLVDKRLITADEIRRMLEIMDSRTPALGAKLVARAWVDPEFRTRLLADGRATREELGISFFEDTRRSSHLPTSSFKNKFFRLRNSRVRWMRSRPDGPATLRNALVPMKAMVGSKTRPLARLMRPRWEATNGISPRGRVLRPRVR